MRRTSRATTTPNATRHLARRYIGGNGGTSCFKGWFVRYIMQGRVGDFQDCSDAGGSADCLHEPILGVQLVLSGLHH